MDSQEVSASWLILFKEDHNMDKTPIYKESFQHAYQHGEETQHIASHTVSASDKM